MFTRLRLALRLFVSVSELRLVARDLSDANEQLRIAALDHSDPRIAEALGLLVRPRMFFHRLLEE
jgi:hypothetical protein